MIALPSERLWNQKLNFRTLDQPWNQPNFWNYFRQMKNITEISCRFHDWSTVQENNFWLHNLSTSLYQLCLHSPPITSYTSSSSAVLSHHIVYFQSTQLSFFVALCPRVKHVWMFYISLYISWLCPLRFCLHYWRISFYFLIHFSILHCLLMCFLRFFLCLFFFACMCRSRSPRSLHSISASCIFLKGTTEWPIPS